MARGEFRSCTGRISCGWRNSARRAVAFSVEFLVLSCLFAALGTDAHEHDHSHGHECVHSRVVELQINKLMDTVYKVPFGAHASLNGFDPTTASRSLLQQEDVQPAPLRIKVDFQIDGLDKDKADFLQEELIPAMVGVLRRSLKIRKPVQGPLKIPRYCTTAFSSPFGGGSPSQQFCIRRLDTCGSAVHNPEYVGFERTCTGPHEGACTVNEGGPGATDADFVLYVTAQNDVGCAPPFKGVASGGFCAHDLLNRYGLPNRPLAGVANFCPQQLSTKPEDFGYMLDTAVHEVLHALLMSSRLMDLYIDEDGNGRGDVMDIVGEDSMIASPAVKREARRMFGCDTLPGAKLENEGGDGTAGSHWERRMFVGELMVGNSIASTRDTMSNVTLALAEDSGWYIPNYEKAGMIVSSFKKGCSFVNADCRYEKQSLSEAFCWDQRPAQTQQPSCTPDHRAIGYCRNDMDLMDGCSIKMAFQNTYCTNPEHDPAKRSSNSASVDMGTRHQPGARCFPVSSGRLSRTEGWYTVSRPDVGAACFETICKDDAVHVRIPESTDHPTMDIECPEGEYIDLPRWGIGYTEGRIGPCPKPSTVCDAWGCPGDCYGNGQCFRGQCYCHVGFIGEDCKRRACTESSCGPKDTCNIMTGKCGSEADETLPVKPKTRKESPRKPKAPKQKRTKQEDKPEPRPVVNIPEEDKPTQSTEQSTGESPSEAPGFYPFNPFGPAPAPAPSSIFGFENGEAGEESGGSDTGSSGSDTVSGVGQKEGGQNVTGTAFWQGYLSDCAVFVDLNRNNRWDDDEPGLLTNPFGRWGMFLPPGAQMVLDPSIGNCRDIFTGRRPSFRLTAPSGSQVISPMTTLAYKSNKISQVVELQNPDTPTVVFEDIASPPPVNASESESPYKGGVWVDGKLLNGLKIKDGVVLEEDVVGEVGDGQEGDEEQAVVDATIISNTVVQVSAFVLGSDSGLEDKASETFKALGKLLSTRGYSIYDLSTIPGVLTLVNAVQDEDSTEPSAAMLDVFSQGVSTINKMALDLSRNADGVELLEGLSKLSFLGKKELIEWSADLSSKNMTTDEYTAKTSEDSLSSSLASIQLPEISKLLASRFEKTDTEDKGGKHSRYPWLDFPNSGAALFGIVFVIVGGLLCLSWGCMRKKSDEQGENDTGRAAEEGRNGEVTVNPVRTRVRYASMS